jgi:hypothetical protein
MALNAYYFLSLSIVATIDLREHHVSVFEALTNLQDLKIISMTLHLISALRVPSAASDALRSCIQG